MGIFAEKDRGFVEAIARLTYTNPFLPDRVDLEREALGRGFHASGTVWSVDGDLGGLNPNLGEIDARLARVLPAARDRLAAGGPADEGELQTYEDLVFYALYARYADVWFELLESPTGGTRPRRAEYDRFAAEVAEHLELPGFTLPTRRDAAFLWAYGFQTRRAFHFAFRHLYGSSLPAAQLRAALWQSIFTHDRRRYRRALVDHMQDWATLVVGPSGTGKELVAQAIAYARYIPFDAETGRFTEHYREHFHALNLSALSPTLIESELFGHVRGAFTGAVADRSGWLETCSGLGTVFLDEIGELDPALQVKLLRVLQARSFQRLGDVETRRFEGKIVAATNRDLEAEIEAGRFREDFYYRLCSDVIRTPSLREQLDSAPDDLHDLVLVIARRHFGETEGAPLAAEVVEWIEGHLGRDYDWPGNVRELEQCVRNVLIRRSYWPPRRTAAAAAATGGARGELAAQVARATLPVEDVLVGYITLVYHETGSYEAAARRLGIDRRTVKAKLDAGFLERLRAEPVAD